MHMLYLHTLYILHIYIHISYIFQFFLNHLKISYKHDKPPSIPQYVSPKSKDILHNHNTITLNKCNITNTILKYKSTFKFPQLSSNCSL